MTQFILNQKLIKTHKPTGMSLLNFIRDEAHLKGTKSGCKEGDCGACTVMIGELKGGEVKYKTVTSCLFPLGNAHGKHIVTIEGISNETLTTVQQQLANEDATQCGFCTPGIVVSLTNYIINHKTLNFDDALNALSGNICRCTGYKSIERATKNLTQNLKNQESTKKELPNFFNNIAERLQKISASEPKKTAAGNIMVAGGTDLLVQKQEETAEQFPKFLADIPELKTLEIKEGKLHIGASVTVTEFLRFPDLNHYFPNLKKQFLLISSEQIRNMATFAGNIVNASPIGDLSIFLLACRAKLTLKSADSQTRQISLKDFFKGYKTLDLNPSEIIQSIELDLPTEHETVNFEKVSKRQYLDIASVNSCIKIKMNANTVETINLSAGGIGPVPFFANKTCEYLQGKTLNANTLKEALRIFNNEISPISDIRGSEKYKRLLARQLLIAHFHILLPKKDLITQEFLSSLPSF